jgi:tRNA modification GTPase
VLDFPDERVACDIDAARGAIERLRTDVDRWRASARQGRVVHDGITVALVGPPNAGKSSLLNALLGRDRAIVSPVPGTTRDVVDGTIALAGVPVRLLDTAGLDVPRDAVRRIAAFWPRRLGAHGSWCAPRAISRLTRRPRPCPSRSPSRR